MRQVATGQASEIRQGPGTGSPASAGIWVLGLRLLILGAMAITVVGVAGRYLGWPLLSSTLGPTLYVFLVHPDSETARLRNSVIGHTAGVAAGLAMLAAFGLWSHPAITVVGHSSLRQAGAAGLAVGLTLLALHLTKAHHAPAAATTILVATGIAHPGKPLYGLLIGLAAVICAGPALGRVPFGRKEAARLNG